MWHKWRGASPQYSNAYMSPITVQRDAEVGSVIGYYSYPQSDIFMSCVNGGNVYWLSKLFLTRSSISGYYNTNVPGVGIESRFSSPASIVTVSGNGAYWVVPGTFRIIKTGPITSGVISSGTLGISYGDDGVTAFTLYFSGASVTEVACSINTPHIQIPLDDVIANSLTSIGTTAKPKTFELGLTCNPGARVNVTMTGTKNTDTSAAGVLQLSGAGSAGVATGVGIQILYNGSPLALNNNIVLKTSPGGQETFPFVARYYQTKSTVTTGDANATATLNLTYQ